jgi:hypothetical protein
LIQADLRFQQLERFAVAAALEKMAQPGVDRPRQLVFEFLDPFGNGLQASGMRDPNRGGFLQAVSIGKA